MAEALDDFKKRFAAIDKAIDTQRETIANHERYMGQTVGVMKEGIKEVGLRVQDLKEEGIAGTTIEAFMGDEEVKKMMAEIKGFLSGIQTELTKMHKEREEIVKTGKLFYALRTDVTNEIAKRKKAVSTKLGTGNKSLPDMEKLLAEMKKYPDEMPMMKVEIFIPEEYADHVKEATEELNAEIAKSKAAALNAFQQQMQEQALNSRVLIGKVADATRWYNTVMEQCAAGEKALKEKKNKELMTAKALIPGPWKQLQDMNTMYQNALKDTWIASKIKDSKDKDKINAGVKSVLDMKTKAGVEAAKIANARL